MADVHVPDLGGDGAAESEPDRSRPGGLRVASSSHGPLKVLLEVVLISVGVFLGLMGEQWREHQSHRELAREALRRFRTEIVDNQQRVQDVVAYHLEKHDALTRYLRLSVADRKKADVSIQGVRPVLFAHTAWDLALATQSLSYVEPDLAFELSRVYALQAAYGNLSQGMLASMYVNPPTFDTDRFLGAVKVFYDDAVAIEPEYQNLCLQVLPRIDAALGQSGS
jgi:hypothetical protein